MSAGDLLLNILIIILLFFGTMWFGSHLPAGICNRHKNDRHVSGFEIALDAGAFLFLVIFFFGMSSNLIDELRNPKPPKGPKRMVVVDVDEKLSPSSIAVINKTIEDWDATIVYTASRTTVFTAEALDHLNGIKTDCPSEKLPLVDEVHFQHRLAYRLSLYMMPHRERRENTIGLVILSSKRTGWWADHTIKPPKSGYTMDHIKMIDATLRKEILHPSNIACKKKLEEQMYVADEVAEFTLR